jgi:hypothetical protein
MGDANSTASSNDRPGLQAQNVTSESVRDNAVVESLCARLVWSRLHEVEALKDKFDELSVLLARVECLRAEIESSVNANYGSALLLAQTCMAGRVEVRQRTTFSEIFMSMVAFLFRSVRATTAGQH